MNSRYKVTKGAGWLATGLGWFSIIIGLLGMLAPQRTARWFGVRNRPLLFKLLGLREIASGLGVLSGRNKGNWLWARTGGDAMDLALLGTAIPQRGSDTRRIGAAMGGIGAITLLDILGALLHLPAKPIHIVRSVIVERSPEDLYGAWRNFANLPNFMENLISVQTTGDRHSHWVAKAPGGTHVEWDAEITEDSPNEHISWRSLGGADVENWGTVQFLQAPGGRGTIVRVTLDYHPPGGRLGALAALLFGREPRLQISVDLHRFEQWMETGFVTTTKGQPAGRSRSESPIYDQAPGR